MAVRLPDKTSFEAGACLGIPAMTAYHAVAVAEAKPGMTVLVSGGAGAVGHYAIQFAKTAGATVITTISSPEKAKLATAAGADHTIDYKRENVGERVMALTGKKGVDAVIELDIAANAKLMPQVLHPRGTIVVYGTGAPEAEVPLFFFLRNAITLKFIYVYELTAAERASGARRDFARARSRHADQQCRPQPTRSPTSSRRTRPSEEGKVLGNVVVTI